MPVTNQWKTRGKAAEEAAKAAEAAKPEPPKEETDARARRVGRLQNLRSGGKAAAEAKPVEASPPVEETNGKEEKSVRRNVSSKWSATQEEPQKVVRKKRLEVTEGSVEEDEVHIDPITGGIVVENEPIRLEGVIRSDDPSEFQKPLEVEKGFAKNLASRFLNAANAQNEESSGRRFKMDVESGEPVVHENEPVRLEGVVRAGDKTEDVIGKRGSIRSIAGRFANPQPRKDSSSDSDSDSDSSDDDRPPARSGPAGRRMLAGRSRIGASGDGNPVVLAENTPAELDPNIVRSDGYRANDPVMEAGWARNMAERWKQQQEQEQVVEKKGSKPAWLIELENAKESEHGVFENEPEVRDDVVRADDEKPDVISVQHTRSLRKMWTQIEKEKDAAEKMPKNRPLPRQKEPSPEPEPPKPPPPVEEPKPRFGRGARAVGRLNFGQLQKEEPPKPVVQEPPPAAPAGRGRGRRFGAAAAAPAPAPAPVQEIETKTSKLNMKPTLKQVPLRK